MVVYLGATTAWGAWLGRGSRSGDEYFLGGRDLPWGAVLLSIVATETSTLTFLSIPGVAYSGSLGFLQIALGYVVGRLLVAVWLLPAYRTGELKTAYEFLEWRFGIKSRRLASIVFMVTRLLADSVRLFATAIPLTLVTGWSLVTSVIIIGAITLIYTYLGGIRAVVLVDAVQMVLYLFGGVVALFMLERIVPGGWIEILSRASEAGKLQLVDTSFDFGRPYTLWAGLIGGAFLSMGSHGTDQLIVQRLLACRDLSASRRVDLSSWDNLDSSSSSESACGRITMHLSFQGRMRYSPLSLSKHFQLVSGGCSSQVCLQRPCRRYRVRSTHWHQPLFTTFGW